MQRDPIGLVAAAGKGHRLGGEIPKQFRDLAGRSPLAWVVMRLRVAGIGPIVAAVPEEHLDLARRQLEDHAEVRCVAGGSSRQDSVARALAMLDGADEELVVVHDAARPAIWTGDLARTVEAARQTGAAVLGRPMTDTVKRVVDGIVEATLDRRTLFRAETPQVFPCGLLREVMRLAEEEGYTGTDESSLVERFSEVAVTAVAAERPNPKLTWDADLELLRGLLEPR